MNPVPSTRRIGWVLPVLLITLHAGACSKERARSTPAPAARSIILISVDTLRSDHLPVYGYRGVQTPAIDALRNDGVLFESAWSQIPLTLPSHATMFTGLLPADNGLRDNAGFRLRSDVPTIAELLKRRSYATGAAVSAYSLRASSGIGRGFDLWDDRFAPTSESEVMGEVQRPGDETLAVAEEWIRHQKGRPFFFFLHLYEPHTPYDPPEPYRSRYALPYDGEIARADELVGDFVTFLREEGLYDDSAIVFLSDHGEGLNDHGEDEHGILLYREAIQVPLLVKLPRSVSKGATVTPSVQLIDVFPTLLALGGADVPPSSDGATPLLDAMRGGRLPDRAIFAETYFPRLHLGWSALHSLVRGNHHLIGGPHPELYDLAADPSETIDISEQERRTRASMLKDLEPLIRPADPTTAIEPEEAAKLQALGYLGSASAGDDGSLPDPKEVIGKFREVRQALWFFQHGRFDEALRATDGLLETNGRMFDVWDIRARSLEALGRPEEALTAARTAMSIAPGSSSLIIFIADLSLELGRPREAAEHARLVLSQKPAEAHEILARAALSAGDLETAESEAAQAAAASPGAPTVEWTLGRVALQRGNRDQALQHFDAAEKVIESRDLPPLRNLSQDRGFVLATMGRKGEAEKAFLREIENFPQGETAWANLLMLYRTSGRSSDADALITRWIQSAPRAKTYAAIADALESIGDRSGAAQWRANGRKRFPAGSRSDG